MTEFELFENVCLSLMPETGIVNLLSDSIKNPSLAQGIPRCEIYLRVQNPLKYIDRAISNGANLISSYGTRS